MNEELEEALAEERLSALADQLSVIHYATNLGYGDEGEGYDYKEQVCLLIAAGWIPPKESE